MNQDRAAPALLAVAETFAALGIAMLLTLILSGVAALYFLGEDGQGTLAERLLATHYRIEFPLVDADSGEPSTGSHGKLLARLRALEVAEQVQITGDDEAPKLVLSGTSSTGRIAAAASGVLAEHGLRGSEFETRRTLDILDPANLRKLAPALLTVQALIFLGVGAVLIRWRLPRGAPLPMRAHVLGGLAGIAAGLVAFGCSLLIGLLLHLIGLPPQEQAWLRDLLEDRATILALAPWILLLVPLSEEVFFRAYVFRFVTDRAGLLVGLGISSAMFAVIHLNPSGILIYLVVGMLFAVVYARMKSLAAPVVAHATYNGLVLAAALLTRFS